MVTNGGTKGESSVLDIEERVHSAKKGVPLRPQVPLGPLSAARQWFTSSSGQLQRRKAGRAEDNTSVLQGSTPRLCPRGQTLPSTPVVTQCIPTQDASPPRRPSSQVLSPLSTPVLKSIPEMLSPKKLLLQLFIQQASLSA